MQRKNPTIYGRISFFDYEKLENLLPVVRARILFEKTLRSAAAPYRKNFQRPKVSYEQGELETWKYSCGAEFYACSSQTISERRLPFGNNGALVRV